MRAAFYQGARTFTTGTLPTPTPGPGQALLRVKRVGSCGTDLHIFHGHLDHPVPKAGITGHETCADAAPLGALVALVSRERGARVVVAEVNRHGLEPLNALGLETVGPDRDPVKFAAEWTGGTGVDVAFEVSGHPAAARAVTDVVRVWGTVSIVAIHAEPVPVNLYQMFARELHMHGARLYAREDWEEAIHLATGGAVPVAPLVSRKIPLEALQQGMEQALGGGPVMKVLVDLTT